MLLVLPFAAPEAVTAPVTAQAETRDPTTGQREIRRDATGQRTVKRDDTGQVIVETDEEGQILIPEGGEPLPRADSLLRPIGTAGVFSPDEERTREGIPGGTDWRTQVALVEGYNTNVVQSQSAIGGPVTRHPSPFTGLDASGELIMWSSPLDLQTFRLQVRGQHYTPLDGYSEPDDGSVNGGWAGQLTLGKRTTLQGRALVTVTSVNSARLSDGPLFQLDPSGMQRIYSLETMRLALLHELAPRWRLVVGADAELSSTLKDQPILLPDGRAVGHHGLDYVQPALDASVFHDLDERNILSGRVRYEPTYITFLVDYARVPPLYGGKAMIHMAETEVGWTHAFTERLRSLTSVGALVSQPPPLDPDRRPIFSPIFSEEVTYVSQYWLATLGANYTYGSASPRLGFGPSVGGATTLQGVPFPHGKLRDLAFLVTGLASRAAFEQGPGSLSRLTYLSGSVELRYGVNTWLGVLGGYEGRYVEFEGASAFPSLLRHVIFVGLSGYFASDRSLPTLETFVSPVNPPG